MQGYLKGGWIGNPLRVTNVCDQLRQTSHVNSNISWLREMRLALCTVQRGNRSFKPKNRHAHEGSCLSPILVQKLFGSMKQVLRKLGCHP